MDTSTSSTPTWPQALADLLDDPSLQPLTDLELNAEGGAPSQRPPPPLPSIAHHVVHLLLTRLTLTLASLAAWRLHDAALWPHLRHLTIHRCSFASSTVPALPLWPIPYLATFTWEQSPGTALSGPAAATLTLAERATHLRIVRPHFGSAHGARQALAWLERLTHVDLDVASLSIVAGEEQVVEALLRHRTLEHVTLANLGADLPDLTRRRCRWRTLTLSSTAAVAALGRLPLAGLERLSIRGYLERGGEGRGAVAARQAGLAALQKLQGQGKLALVAEAEGSGQSRRWRLQPGDGLFTLFHTGDMLPALLPLVLEAGEGVNHVFIDASSLPLPRLREHVAPLLSELPGRISTLCTLMRVDLPSDAQWPEPDEFWWASLLGCLPASVAHVKVEAMVGAGAQGTFRCASAMVRGGAATLRHPLTLTLLHSGQISDAQAAQLVLLAVPPGRQRAAPGRQQRQTFLTVRVVRAG